MQRPTERGVFYLFPSYVFNINNLYTMYVYMRKVKYVQPVLRASNYCAASSRVQSTDLDKIVQPVR